MRFQLAICDKPNMQTVSTKTFPVAKLCQVENELFGPNCLSLKKRKLVKQARPKNQFLKTYKMTRLCQTEKMYQAE